MNKEQAQILITAAKEFIGQDIEINILDRNNNFDKKANCKFTDWSSTSFSVNKGNPSINLYAKLTDNSDGKIYTPSLESVITEFKRIRGKQ